MRDGKPRWTGRIGLVEDALDAPRRWKKPRRIFVNSMSDLFHEDVSDEWLNRIWNVMRWSQRHTFQVLTKRPERMRNYLLKKRKAMPGGYAILPNVHIGVSVEDQATANKRIRHLLQTPAAVWFVSVEPMLCGLELDADWMFPRCKLCGCHGVRHGMCGNCLEHFGNQPLLDWIICGGESGPNARPMHPDWARSLRDQCKAAGVPFFFKQWGKKSDGNLLDGKVHQEFPSYWNEKNETLKGEI